MRFRSLLMLCATIVVSCISGSPLKAKDKDSAVGSADTTVLQLKDTRELNDGENAEEMQGDARSQGHPASLNQQLSDKYYTRVRRAVPPQVAETAMELAGKQLEIMAEQQQKGAEFVNKEIELDIAPQKGWATENVVVPAGMQITARESAAGDDKEPEGATGQGASVYPFGVGGVLMNGCYGSGYQPGDPCYEAAWRTNLCLNLIDGAAFIGVGFDGRGEYSPESRKMSIVQRTCAGKVKYEDFDVPDTMNVQGVYDARGYMSTFFSRSEYQDYLQQQAGVAGSAFGFYGGVKRAFGSSSLSGSQKYMAVFDLDIDRYEMHIEEVKPEDLSVGFLKDFMDLPASNDDGEDYRKYQNFIQRWGTHYVKSAKFGGELEIRKTMEASEVQNKEDFGQTMEVEFRNIFASFNAKKETKKGSSSKSQAASSSLSFSVQGGSQEIALLITDIESPTFKQDMDNWLKSIADYPKPYKFTMGPITDLLDFSEDALFKNDDQDWGCEGHKDSLVKDENSDRMYYTIKINGTETKKYCDYVDRISLANALDSKRQALRTAVDTYLEEGTISSSDFSIHPGKSGCQSKNFAFQSEAKVPSWKEITETEKVFQIVFDMEHALESKDTKRVTQSDSEVFLRYRDGQWQTSDDGHYFPLYDGCALSESGDPSSLKVCIRDLVLKYDVQTGKLKLDKNDFPLARKMFSPLEESWMGRTLARVEYSQEELFNMRERVGYLPCNTEWSNVLQFRPSDTPAGKCLSFSAASKGTIYVVFAAVPSNPNTWYYFEISPRGVAIMKSQKLQVSTVNQDAVSLGDLRLYEKYLVCFTEKDSSVTLEFGKAKEDKGQTPIYLSFVDTEDTNTVRFYAFGSGEHAVQVVDSHVISRDSLKASCEGGSVSFDGRCTQRCHELCDPEKGCRRTPGQEPKPTECNACRFLKLEDTGECVKECPAGYKQGSAGLCVVAAKNCQEWLKAGKTSDGVYSVNPDGEGRFDVYCDQTTEGGGYAVFQRRQDGSVDFNRGWDDYKSGFGNLDGEFWLGLDNIHRLTKQSKQELLVVLQDWDEVTKQAAYDGFTIAGEHDKYRMDYDKFSGGSAGDSLYHQRRLAFTTYDRDNDLLHHQNCAVIFKGGWWFHGDGCHASGLNGLFGKIHPYGQGIMWRTFRGFESFMKRSAMQVRPM